MQMVAHAISTGGLFIIVGALHDRIQTREIGQMGGLWTQVPKMGAMGLLFVLASLGLPGLGNFIAEILILTGSFMASKVLTIIAAAGFIAATLYSLRIMQKVFYGTVLKKWEIADFGFREMIVMGSLAIAIIWLGLFPNSILNATQQMVQGVVQQVTITAETPKNSKR
jgi:NADH-quinone oxidoreductase subunit M